MQNVRDFSATQLRDQLIAVTIGGGQKAFSLKQKKLIFCEYLQRAFPEIEILRLALVNTSAALNSVSATADVLLNGKKIFVFAKIHIESGTKDISAVGVQNEYANASLLSD